jgi:hypothetical protein
MVSSRPILRPAREPPLLSQIQQSVGQSHGGVIAVMRLSGRLGLTAGLRAATAGTLSVPATSVTQQLRAANDLWPDFQYPLSAERSSIEVHTGFVEPLVGLRVTF